MNKSFLDYCQQFSSALREGRSIVADVQWKRNLQTGAPPPAAGPVLLFSPHPDDECIVGGLPLRFQKEIHARVINVAVTLGSRKDQRERRLDEVKKGCRFLGFELVVPQDLGLDNITPLARSETPAPWFDAVQLIKQLLIQIHPSILFFPHAEDWNRTHEGVHQLVMDALADMENDFSTHLVQTEFWRPMKQPNMMVELSEDNVGTLLTALSLHKGEVARNPYHLRLPAWMMDNVRRGAEVVGGQGKEAPEFTFATLYRFSTWENGMEVVPAEKYSVGKDDHALLAKLL